MHSMRLVSAVSDLSYINRLNNSIFLLVLNPTLFYTFLVTLELNTIPNATREFFKFYVVVRF